MVERIFRKLTRKKVQKPISTPSQEVHPIPHTTKKPMLAVTGTRPDKICSICLGKLQPGIPLTFCDCGKFFHMRCILELGECPICGFMFKKRDIHIENTTADVDSGNEIAHDDDMMETVFQCPVCDSYVSEDAESCQCGAVFDMEDREIYLCPQCEHEVSPDSDKCEKCGTVFG